MDTTGVSTAQKTDGTGGLLACCIAERDNRVEEDWIPTQASCSHGSGILKGKMLLKRPAYLLCAFSTRKLKLPVVVAGVVVERRTKRNAVLNRRCGD